MGDTYASYQSQTRISIQQALNLHGCQPILFVGSGLSKRFFGAPNWDELLEHMASGCPAIKYDYGYFKQTLHDLLQIGSSFAASYRD